MKFKILAGLALTTVALAACKVDIVDDGLGGLGGSGDTVTSTTTTTSTKTASTATTNTTATNSVTVTGSTTTGGTACVDEATCDDCQQCAFNGECSEEIGACAAGSPCQAVNACLGMCPQDNPATADTNEFFQCACGAEPMECDPGAAAAGSCFGDNAAGVDPYLTLLDCIFGTDGMSGECGGNPDCG